jgi:transcription elongation factor Elf1
MNTDLDCPKCGTNIVKSYNNEAKLRCKLVKWDRNGMFAVCKSCDKDVSIDQEFLKAIQSSFIFEVPSEEK